MLIEGLCQSYHWTVAEAMRLTIPQIIMLNHGAWVNQKRADARSEARRKQQEKEEENPVVFGNKRADELTTEQYMAYWVNGDSDTSIREI